MYGQWYVQTMNYLSIGQLSSVYAKIKWKNNFNSKFGQQRVNQTGN